MHARDPLGGAVSYATDILRQGIDLAVLAEQSGLQFQHQIGPHLRHVIEHYETLLAGIEHGVIDYDNRRRNREIEQDPAIARQACEALIKRFNERLQMPWPESVAVVFDGGVTGDHRFVSGSTPLRELLFVAGHAVHHYALLSLAMKHAGIVVPDIIGKAPATVRYEREKSA